MIAPHSHADFVAHMEDILKIYQMPYDPKIPVVCMDEQPYQLIKETRAPIPCKPGQLEKIDFEYERAGVTNHFMFTEPLAGWRKVSLRERKTAVDWAQEVKNLLDDDYKDRAKVILVCDNLSTHKIASFYEAFAPEEARRLAEKIEIHYTPKHGSWLNVAEIELSVLTKQCLSRRIANPETLKDEVTAWAKKRNSDQTGVDWQFTAENARIKLKKLYPKIQT